MSVAEENSADDKHGHPSARDAPADEPVRAESWRKRFGHSLASPLVRILAAAIARLQSLKARLGDDEVESEERPHAKSAHPATHPEAPKAETRPAPAAEAGTKKPHRLRNLLIVIILIIASGGIGAGAAYSLLSRLLRDQSLAIESHDQDIRAFQLQEQEQGKKLAAMLQQLETERKLRIDMEAHLVEAEQRRIAAEAKPKQPIAEVAKPESPGKPEPHAQKETEIDVKIVGRPSKATSFRPPTAGNCNLAGSDPAALRRCVEEYNRK